MQELILSNGKVVFVEDGLAKKMLTQGVATIKLPEPKEKEVYIRNVYGVVTSVLESKARELLARGRAALATKEEFQKERLNEILKTAEVDEMLEKQPKNRSAEELKATIMEEHNKFQDFGGNI